MENNSEWHETFRTRLVFFLTCALGSTTCTHHATPPTYGFPSESASSYWGRVLHRMSGDSGFEGPTGPLRFQDILEHTPVVRLSRCRHIDTVVASIDETLQTRLSFERVQRPDEVGCLWFQKSLKEGTEYNVLHLCCRVDASDDNCRFELRGWGARTVRVQGEDQWSFAPQAEQEHFQSELGPALDVCH